MKKRSKPRAVYAIFDKFGMQVARREVFHSKKEGIELVRRLDYVWKDFAPHTVEKYTREVKRREK